MRFLALAAILICLAAGAFAQVAGLPGSAQPAETALPALPEVLTPDIVRDLVSRLSDDQVRALLLDRLDAVAEDQAQTAAEDGWLVEFGRKATIEVGASISGAIASLPLLFSQIGQAFSLFFERLGGRGIFFLCLVLSIAVTGGLVVEFTFRRLVRGWVESGTSDRSDYSLWQTLVFLSKRLCADVVAVFIFFFAANMIGIFSGLNLAPFVLKGDMVTLAAVGSYVQTIWVYLIVLPRIGAAFSRFMLAPHRPEFRLMYTDDPTARFLFVHQVGLVFLVGFTFWIFQFFNMSGIQMGGARLGFWMNLALHLYLIWVVWTARAGLSMMMRGPDPNLTPGELWAARMYPGFVIAATILTFWLVEVISAYHRWDVLERLPHIYMLFLISFAPTFDAVVRGLVRHLMPPMSGDGALAEEAYLATKRSYIRIGRVIAFVIVVLLIARIWGLDYRNIAMAGVGAQVAGRLIEVLVILAVGYFVFEVVSLWINRKLAAERTAAGLGAEQETGGEGGGAGLSRLSTVLPLLLATLRGVIIVVFALLALGQAGIDTTPLLAGAGIVGIAIGFGAQKLVTDVVSGIFFLIDDAFRTGEYVEVEGTMGTVEKISIRSMQLRHHRGPVHTIPYGEIPKLTNYSRDWVIMKLKFTVPFDTDPNKVKKIFKRIGAEMLEEPLYKDDFLEPFKSQGVFAFDDVGMVIRGKFMAKPGTQFMIRKEVYNRVKRELEAAGIGFARREVRVAIPGADESKDMTEAEKAALAAGAAGAVQSAIEDQLPPAAPASEKPSG